MRRAFPSTLLLLMLVLTGTGARAAITQDTVATAGTVTTGLSSLSWSHTVNPGGNVYLVVALSYRVDNNSSGAGAGTYASGMTANGTAMTCAISIADNGTGSCGTAGSGTAPEPYIRGEIWYLSLGTVSAQTSESIVATLSVANSAKGSAIAATSISYFGVSGVSSGGDVLGSGINAQSASLAVTAAATQLVVSSIALPKSSTTVASTPNASLSDISGTGNYGASQDATSSASGSNPTMGWTWTGKAPYVLTAAVLTAAPTTTRHRAQVITD